MQTKADTPTRRRGFPRLGILLAGLGFLVALLASADIAYSAWARTVLGQAAREGARFAITGRPLDLMEQEASIREVIRENSFWLLDDAESSAVEVRYTATDSDLTLLRLRVKASRRTPLAAILGSSYPVDVSASCFDVMEAQATPSDLRDGHEQRLARLTDGTT